MTVNLTREQWMLAHAIAGVVNACNAPFCVGENEEREETNRDPSYIDNVADEVAKLTSKFAIEDAIQVLEVALTRFDGYRASETT